MAIQRGEVYFINLDPTIGREQAGRRPVLVGSKNVLNRQPLVVLVVPGTKQSRSSIPYPWNVESPAGEAGRVQNTVFLTFQTRAVDHRRFQESPRGSLSQPFMTQSERALAWSLVLPTPATPTP